MSLGTSEYIKLGHGARDTLQPPALPRTYLAFAKRLRMSPMVSSGHIINRKACSPFSDLMRNMESGGTGMVGDSWLLQVQRPSVLPSSRSFPSTLLSPLPRPHLCRSEAKAGVSTMISWIGAGIGQQFWKAAMKSGWSPRSHLREDWLILEQEWMSPMSQRARMFCVKGRRLWKATPSFFQSDIRDKLTQMMARLGDLT